MNVTTAAQMTGIALYSDEFFALAHSEDPIRESAFAPVWEDCHRCAGYGYIPGFEHVENAVCFGCYGGKGKMVSAKTQAGRCRTERKNHREANAQAKIAEQERQERDAQRAEWTAAHADVVEALKGMKGDFAIDMRDQIEYYGKLSEKQAAAVLRIAQENAERAEKAVEVPAGREVITGKILSVKRTESHYGYTPTVNYRATIEDDRGFRVNGNLPGALIEDLFTMWEQEHTTSHSDREHWEDIAKGVRVTLTATLEPKETGFGFWKRAARASIR